MPMLQWSSEFSVGVNEMDEQHISLFHLFNDLCAAIEDGKDRAETEPLLCRLLEYTQEHFASEEGLLRSAGFPELTNHGHHHKDLSTLMKEYLTRFHCGELGSSTNLLSFLREWLIHHIQTEDRLYGPWLNSRGVK
jgi:hemerythrin